MELDDLKEVWRSEMNTLARSDHNIWQDTKSKVDDYDRKVRFRDVREILVAAVVAGFFGFAWFAGYISNPLSQAGALVIILACLFISARLVRARATPAIADWTLKSRVASEITKLERQKGLLGSVALWYVAPIMLGVFLVSLGEHVAANGTYLPSPGLGFYWLLCLAFSFFLVWLNQRAVRENIEPLLHRLRSLEGDLGELDGSAQSTDAQAA